MNTYHNNAIGIIILAAGKGTRMGGDKLKVMYELNGRPFIDYVVQSVEKAVPDQKPTVVVCDNDPAVQNYLGDRAVYVIQQERLGTGHAVSVAEKELKGNTDHVVVLYGDMPFVSSNSIERLIKRHQERDNTITMMTITVPDFEDWRANFYDYSRVIRGADGHIIRTVENKDATTEELLIKEINPCYYCFKSDWLWENINKIKNDNKQKEYYLTDLVRLAIENNQKLSSITVPPEEALGINNPDQYEIAQDLINRKKE